MEDRGLNQTFVSMSISPWSSVLVAMFEKLHNEACTQPAVENHTV